MNGTANQTIGFSTNWNQKLDARFFTTIRISNPAKYYRGNVLSVKFKEKTFSVIVETVETKKISEFTDLQLSLDTGYPKDEAVKILMNMYPTLNFETAKFDYVLLRKFEPSDLKAKELDLFSSLDKLKHPDPEKKEAVIQRLKEISQMPKVAFLDTETTGFDGEIIELSILSLDEKVLFNELIKPVRNQIHPDAVRTHGIFLNDLEKKNYLHHYKYILQQIFENYVVLIYNSEFDLKILKNSFRLQLHLDEEMGNIDLFKANTECLMNAFAVFKGTESDKSYAYQGFKTWKLAEACKEMGVDISGIKAHRALGDCEMTRMLFLKMVEGK